MTSPTKIVVLIATLLCACTSAANGPVTPETTGSVSATAEARAARGLSFVEAQCSGCHAVRPGVRSPNPQAPSFAIVANDGQFDEATLRTFFRDGHDTPAAMSIRLDDDEAEIATAYIMSLRRHDGRRDKPVTSQPPPRFALPLVGQGHVIVRERCSSCHSTELLGLSPRADAPPLRDLFKRYPVDALRIAFSSGVHVGHRDMPTFKLAQDEVEAILAYLKSIDPCAQPSSDRLAMKRCFAPL